MTSPGNVAPRGLLVDFGGVLTNPVYPLLENFCTSKGLPGDAMVKLISPESSFSHRFNEYECGEVSADVFLPEFAAALGVGVEELDDLLKDLVPDERMFDAVTIIRRNGIPTCLVSNSWGTDLYPRDLLAKAFDDVVISEEVGLRKPDVAIFQLAADRISTPAEHCVFIDDSEHLFDGAQQLGMTTIHHVSVDSTLARLGQLFGLELGDSLTSQTSD